MRKYFTMLAVATLAVACQKDNIDIPSTGNLSNAITISFSEKTTRGSYNNSLVWSWSANDEIKGYQNAGEKTRNTLTHESEGTFSCAEFTYNTTEPAQFHFFYPATAEQEGKLVAPQEGVWNPILVGSTSATTLQNIGTVELQHLTSALEIRASGSEKITAVSLTSANDFVGSWSVNEDLTYTQNFDGNSIELSELEANKVVINMPVLTTDELTAKDITLSVTTTGGTTSKQLTGMSFVAGKRTIIHIREIGITYFDNLSMQGKIKQILAAYDNIIAIKFIADSNFTNADYIQKDNQYAPIYFNVNGTTLEIHTAAKEFMYSSTNATNLFAGTSSYVSGMERIQSLDLSNFNTSNIVFMKQMFAHCYALTSLTLSPSFDTSKVTDMNSMFFNCYALTSLDLSSFDTSNVTDMGFMFKQCNALTSLTFSSNFDTSKVTNMTQMFVNCYVLTSLDLSSFSFRGQNLNYTNIFNGLGKDLTDPQKTTVWVSNANASWFDGKTLGDQYSNYEIINKSNPQ